MASFLITSILVASLLIATCDAQLSATSNDRTCPTLQTVARDAMIIAASIIRLQFHDSFVNVEGNPATIFKGEKVLHGVTNSLRFEAEESRSRSPTPNPKLEESTGLHKLQALDSRLVPTVSAFSSKHDVQSGDLYQSSGQGMDGSGHLMTKQNSTVAENAPTSNDTATTVVSDRHHGIRGRKLLCRPISAQNPKSHKKRSNQHIPPTSCAPHHALRAPSSVGPAPPHPGGDVDLSINVKIKITVWIGAVGGVGLLVAIVFAIIDACVTPPQSTEPEAAGTVKIKITAGCICSLVGGVVFFVVNKLMNE